ncbi:hypothetical protein GQ600_15979 [Phytophthora cactorum]|nr:hypothetical protein GQ600_15979 [Phytophthora cactorum]
MRAVKRWREVPRT